MMKNLKVTCYGVRPNEVPFFHKLNTYGFELNLVESLLNHQNVEAAKGTDAVILRGNCLADRQNIKILSEYGIKYLFTRTVGFNHIDLQAAADYNMLVARVPSYSPNAIAELALTLGMMLLRHTAYTTNRTSQYDFCVDSNMFSKEIRNCTVGVIGTGRIGLTEAILYKGLGADVLGYDIYQSEEAKKVVTFKDLDTVIAESDIISLHIPYFPGENENFVDAEFLSKVKPGAILINTARGELQDNSAILAALETGQLSGFGTDVFAKEASLFFKKFNADNPLPDATVKALVDLYPRVLITPHIGSNTDEALSNMIETSYQNLYEVVSSGKVTSVVTLPPAQD